MMRIRTGSRLAVLLAATLALTGCGGSGEIDNELSFRLIQASPDTALVNFYVDGVRLRTAVDYKGGTGFIIVTPRSYDFGVEAIVPGDDEMIIDMPDTPLAAGTEYTWIVVGKDETDSVQALAIENPIADIAVDMMRVQVAHVAPDAPTVDVYVTAPTDVLAAATPLAQVTYGNDPPDPESIPSGTYIIRVTPAGVTDTVLFQSGELTFRSRDDLLVMVVANTGTGTGPVSVVVNDTRSNIEIQDVNVPSDLRVVHASPDAPALDVVGEPATEGAANVTFASGLTYLGYTGYISAPRDTYLIRGVLSSSPTPTTAPFTVTRTLVAGQRATLFAANVLASIDDLVLTDDIRPVYAEGRLRVVHVAPATAVVDVYIVPTGTPIAGVSPNLVNLGFRAATSHLSFAPGAYTVTFTETGTETVVASVEVGATAGTVHTAILVDEVRVDTGSDGKPPAVLLIDDLAG